MPHDDPDPEDPLTLTGVELPAEAGEVRAMAEAFAEEFLMLGFPPGRVAAMFADARYAGPHLAFRQLGEAAVRELVDEVARPWRQRHA
jgi:hypothetical protein